MSEWRAARRLLVAFLGEHDGVHDLLPALEGLGAALPGARLSWLGVTHALPLDRAFPAFERIVLYRHKDGAVLDAPGNELSLIDRVRNGAFDAAIIFTHPGESPWLLAYTCYLAGIPLRAGQSAEFGGGVLSHEFKPPADGEERHLALLRAIGLDGRQERSTETSWIA